MNSSICSVTFTLGLILATVALCGTRAASLASHEDDKSRSSLINVAVLQSSPALLRAYQDINPVHGAVPQTVLAKGGHHNFKKTFNFAGKLFRDKIENDKYEPDSEVGFKICHNGQCWELDPDTGDECCPFAL